MSGESIPPDKPPDKSIKIFRKIITLNYINLAIFFNKVNITK